MKLSLKIARCTCEFTAHFFGCDMDVYTKGSVGDSSVEIITVYGNCYNFLLKFQPLRTVPQTSVATSACASDRQVAIVVLSA